ncbi:hypothetical protein LI90_4391 (plasmid) [Carbonactinospora thermoautotrophica]|uniref:Uncharacterized protein n=1 Tax=Carbonactinospora thermoautotrophica TaxID=1469144 RepID=A0A132MI22_9ACTN|nr:hypothetical protein LI90_4391 [Carbonactinospora thermoautotrophica]
MTMAETAALFKVVTVRAVPDGDVYNRDVWVEQTYTVAHPREALQRFAQEFPEVVRLNDAAVPAAWITAWTPGRGPRPEERLMNWERDPDAEVSDGWLSNMAAAVTNLRNQLEWEPRYCTRATVYVPCPGCVQLDGSSTLLTRKLGRYGAYYQCGACGWKTGARTRKARQAHERAYIAGWCGATLYAGVNPSGVPITLCGECDRGYRWPTAGQLYR